MIRTVVHICGEMFRHDTTTCGAEGYWREWGSWTGWSVTCGACQMTRVRYDSCAFMLIRN